MSVRDEKYSEGDLIEDYGKAKAEVYLSKVRLYYKEKGVPLGNPAAMARTWIVRDGYRKESTSGKRPALEPETRSLRHISSMLFAMGRMEHDEMRMLPGELFRGRARIEGDNAVIDWPVEGMTDEIIERVEHCLGMKLIFTTDQGNLPF